MKPKQACKKDLRYQNKTPYYSKREEKNCMIGYTQRRVGAVDELIQIDLKMLEVGLVCCYLHVDFVQS